MAPPAAATRALEASARIHDLLQRLHAASEAQEKSLSQIFFYVKMLASYYIWGSGWSASADDHMRDKYVSLEQDKCQFMYLLARGMGARNIVEAGTSFGVSTIYLALAVGQNVADARAAGGRATGKVIATEQEPTKAAKAREHWKQAGDEVEPWIELREGDLRETLKVAEGMPEQIDMLLLDSMSFPYRPEWHPWLTGRSLDANGTARAGDCQTTAAQGSTYPSRQHGHGKGAVQGVSGLHPQSGKWFQDDDDAVLRRAGNDCVSTVELTTG